METPVTVDSGSTPVKVRDVLSSLRRGQAVQLPQYGHTLNVTVQREYYHQDGTGAADSYGVKVGFGPGRWNTFVGVDSILAGFNALTVPAEDAGPTVPRTSHTNPYNAPDFIGSDADVRWCHACHCWDLGLVETEDSSAYTHSDH